MEMEKSMTDVNGNIINSGDTVNIIICGELDCKGIFRWAKEDLATITELGIPFRKGGIQGYSIQSLKKYVYAIKN